MNYPNAELALLMCTKTEISRRYVKQALSSKEHTAECVANCMTKLAKQFPLRTDCFMSCRQYEDEAGQLTTEWFTNWKHGGTWYTWSEQIAEYGPVPATQWCRANKAKILQRAYAK